MSRQLDQTLAEHAQQLHDEHPFVWLYEIELPTTPPTRYRLTNHGEAIDFDTDSDADPLTFSSFPISHGEIRATNEGDLTGIQVSVSNVTREVGRVIDDHDGLTGQPILVRVVSLANLGNPAAKIEWRGEIAKARTTQDVCVFELSALNIARAAFPRWRHSSSSCRFQFGSPRCGYLIIASPGETVGTGFSTCGRNFDDCTDRGLDEAARSLPNQHPFPRFGAKRGIPRR